jgi:hypothetical protein
MEKGPCGDWRELHQRLPRRPLWLETDEELQGLKHSQAPATQSDLHAVYRVSRNHRNDVMEWVVSLAQIQVVCAIIIVGVIVFAPILQKLAMEALPK